MLELILFNVSDPRKKPFRDRNTFICTLVIGWDIFFLGKQTISTNFNNAILLKHIRIVVFCKHICFAYKVVTKSLVEMSWKQHFSYKHSNFCHKTNSTKITTMPVYFFLIKTLPFFNWQNVKSFFRKLVGW